jgi:hypothetical protein
VVVLAKRDEIAVVIIPRVLARLVSAMMNMKRFISRAAHPESPAISVEYP